MGSPLQLLAGARAFARDFPRDEMPKGYLWDVQDFVPSIIDASLTCRGKWRWASDVTGSGPIGGGIYAPFGSGDRVLVQTYTTPPHTPGRVLRLEPNLTTPDISGWTDLGPAMLAIQNPVWFSDAGGEQAVSFDGTEARQPQLWRLGGVVDANPAHSHAAIGTVWQNALFTGGAPGEESVMRWSVPGKDLTSADSYDANAFQPTSARITGMQGMRTCVLIFHPTSVQRFRGGPLPNTAAGIDDSGVILEGLFDRVGCTQPRTIAVWNDQCVFADEHGVHMTDGATIRNLTAMGGISYYWRLLYGGAVSLAATIFLDYYIITLRHPTIPPTSVEATALPDIGPPPPHDLGGAYATTLVCDLNRKQWFKFSNVNAFSMFSGGGGAPGGSIMERAWAGVADDSRLSLLGPMFYPDTSVYQVDDNGLSIQPHFETGWYRLSPEGRKRIRFAYLSYDCREPSYPDVEPLRVGYLTSDTVGRSYKQAGTLPESTGYQRYRLPINKFPYGIAFYVEALGPIKALRVYDLGVEAQASERSRVG